MPESQLSKARGPSNAKSQHSPHRLDTRFGGSDPTSGRPRSAFWQPGDAIVRAAYAASRAQARHRRREPSASLGISAGSVWRKSPTELVERTR
jgi:hypothetical protein